MINIVCDKCGVEIKDVRQNNIPQFVRAVSIQNRDGSLEDRLTKELCKNCRIEFDVFEMQKNREILDFLKKEKING